MAKANSWSAIKAAKLSPERITRIRREADEELATLSIVRKALGVTQAKVSAVSGIDQAEISRMEHRGDFRVSSLRRYAEALGAELEVNIVAHGKRTRVG